MKKKEKKFEEVFEWLESENVAVGAKILETVVPMIIAPLGFLEMVGFMDPLVKKVKSIYLDSEFYDENLPVFLSELWNEAINKTITKLCNKATNDNQRHIYEMLRDRFFGQITLNGNSIELKQKISELIEAEEKWSFEKHVELNEKNEIIELFNKELKKTLIEDKYNKLWKVLTDTRLTALENKYIKLNLAMSCFVGVDGFDPETICKFHNTYDIHKQILPDLHRQGKQVILIDLLKSAEEKVFCLLGPGGRGKTYTLLDIWRTLMDKSIYVPLAYVGQYGNSVCEYISKVYLGKDTLNIEASLVNFLKEKEFVFLLDGLNECAKERQNQILLEISNLINRLPGLKVVFTSRISQVINKNIFAHDTIMLSVMDLEEKTVKSYINDKKNIPYYIYDNESLLEILRNPMMLTLFCRTFEGDYNQISPEGSNNIKTGADLIEYYFECQIKKMKEKAEDDEVMKRYLTIHFLLPIITKDLLFRQSGSKEMGLGIEEGVWNQLCNQTVKDIKKAFRRYEEWFRNLRSPYNPADTNTTCRITTFDYFATLKNGLGEEILMIAKSFDVLKEEGVIMWSHESFKDWFAAKGIMLGIEYEQEKTAKAVDEISLRIISNSTQRNMLFYTLPVLRNAYDMISKEEFDSCWKDGNTLKDKKLKNRYMATSSFSLLVTAISYIYDEVVDTNKNAYKFSMIALKLLEAAEEKWNKSNYFEYCNALSGTAYGILRVKQKVEDAFDADVDYEGSCEYAHTNLLKAKKYVLEYPEVSQRRDELLTKIEGNLGAYYLNKHHREKNREKKVWLLEQCRKQHQEALETRLNMESKNNNLIAQSYNGIATAEFYLVKNDVEHSAEHLEASVYNHIKAIEARESERDRLSAELRKTNVGILTSINRILGGKLTILENACSFEVLKKELDEIIKLYVKGDQLVSKETEAFTNEREAEDFIKKCRDFISLITDKKVNATVDDILLYEEKEAEVKAVLERAYECFTYYHPAIDLGGE